MIGVVEIFVCLVHLHSPHWVWGKSESDSKNCQPHRVSRNWISSPSVERKTDSCCSWVNFDFQRRADLDHTFLNLKLNTTFIQVTAQGSQRAQGWFKILDNSVFLWNRSPNMLTCCTVARWSWEEGGQGSSSWRKQPTWVPSYQPWFQEDDIFYKANGWTSPEAIPASAQRWRQTWETSADHESPRKIKLWYSFGSMVLSDPRPIIGFPRH